MQRAHFWLGLVVGAILAAALLFSIYYVPRKGITFSRDPMTFTLVLDEAHGLHAGSPVLVAGVEAGEIEAIEIKEIPGKGYRVLASVSVHDGERFGPMLRMDSSYQVAQSGILGEATLAIAPGGQGPPVAGELVDGHAPTSLGAIVDDLAVITKRIADFVDGRQAGDPNLKRMLVDLQESVRNIRDLTEKFPK